MPFVKLDTKILDSTLWIERECREVFITSLLMAEPLEVNEPMEALMVDSLEHLGFTVQPGWYGFVHAAGPGIVRRAMVPEQSGMLALEKLSAPDPGSRSSDHEGRRMVRVDGGYVILNYMKYRERDYTAAERQRRLRERKKLKVTRDSDTVTPQRHASSRMQIADADADAEKSKPSPTKTVGGELGSPEFAQFWKAYPYKVDRLETLKVWVKGMFDGLSGEILAGLEAWKQSAQWKDPDKIPYPSTWLSKRRWKELPGPAIGKAEKKARNTDAAIERYKQRPDYRLD